ncbi:DUF262 domain-containing protein [Vibrio campbellii]|uniref:DUF262 domain-containing protein n=1 Tax=Vibrio campbellii TaxID=680 RepID=UPI001D17486A|nr:DUF262 domain-containing protein [Vibrio campbellii]MCC4226259.1 DUF262 domain-containing protein [Vibrio campbellii]
MSLSYNTEPKVSFLTHVLRELEEGIVKIPRFQRQIVWDWSQRRDLLCSIIEGLPIGSILIWQTRNDSIRYHHKIGPFSITDNVKTSYNLFLMDGLQRLSSLYGILKYDNNVESEDLGEYDVYCDLDTDDVENMFFLKSDLILEDGFENSVGRYMPMSCILDPRELIRFQRTIPFEKECWIDKSDEVSSAFKNYKIPIIPLESDSQDVVTKSFERINTRGTVMSETHMLNALSYKSDFDLLELIDNFNESFFDEDVEWKNLDNSSLLSLVKLNLGFDIFYKNTDKLAKHLNREILEKSFQGFKKLSMFCEELFGVSSPTQFPYKSQMIGLAYAIEKLPKSEYTKLKSWYILTGYTGAFSGSARNTTNAIIDLGKFISTGEFNWSLNIKPTVSIWSKHTSFRSARCKLWASALVQKSGGNISLLSKVISNRGRYLKRPYDFSSSGIEKGLQERPGLYFVCIGDTINISNLLPSEYEYHFLNEQLIELWLNKEYKEFASLREELIFQWEYSHLVKPASYDLGFREVISV